MRSAILKSLAVLVLLVGGAAVVLGSWLQAVGRCAVAANGERLSSNCHALGPDALIYVYKNFGHVWMPLAGIATMLLAIVVAYALMSAPGKVLRAGLLLQAIAAVAFVAINLTTRSASGSDLAALAVMVLIPPVLCGIPVVAIRRRDDRWLWMLPLEGAIVALCVGTTVYLLQRAG